MPRPRKPSLYQRPGRAKSRSVEAAVTARAPSIPQFLTAFDVAARLSCTYHKALVVMRQAGAHKIGSLVRVAEPTLLAYLEKCSEPSSIARPQPPRARARPPNEKRDDGLPNVSSVAEFLKLRRRPR